MFAKQKKIKETLLDCRNRGKLSKRVSTYEHHQKGKGRLPLQPNLRKKNHKKNPHSLKKNAIKTNVTSVKSKNRLSLSGWLNTQEAEALIDMKL